MNSTHWTTTGLRIDHSALFWKANEPRGSQGTATILQSVDGYSLNAEKPADALNKYICALPGEIELIGLELELDCNEFYASIFLSFFKRSNVSSDESNFLFLFFGSADLPS